MTDTQWHILELSLTPIYILGGRLWSMWEHRKTGKQVDKIYLMMNGEFQKKIEEAIELGRQEVINKEKP